MREVGLLLIKVLEILTGVIVGGLLIRFFLKLFGANPGATFVNWLYDITRPLLEPFAGIFPAWTFRERLVLEWNTLVTILIYLVLSYILVKVISLILLGNRRR
jgi:hypothetical protein